MKFALVGMPWFWAHMPSIQLAVLKDVLNHCQVESQVFEFYADFADAIDPMLYRKIANTGTFLGERLFTQFYFDELRETSCERLPPLSFCEPEIEQHIFRFATPIVDEFLDKCLSEANWGSFDAVCLTLTAQQVGASMAFARRLRARHPHVRIIVGGAGCAGEMGAAFLEICREADIAVHGEAESSVPALIKALRGQIAMNDVGGISWRNADGSIASTLDKVGAMHRFGSPRSALDFDAYFERFAKLPRLNAMAAWIPFESSRGCWYGEKSQCTFCGLNEIIKFRQRDTTRIFDELQVYENRYKISNFFAVDLIMPRTFFDDFLPQVISSEKNWTIFYEVKSNIKRQEMEMLATAGVTWIQPGIESLSDHVLKLMRKGVSAARNILTLRLAAEKGVIVSWNLISNFPTETPADYWAMARLFPLLHHLDAPSGIAPFEVHRFSPFHEQPEEHGVRITGPHRRYAEVFPAPSDLLERLVYRFEYDLQTPSEAGLEEAHRAVSQAVADWTQARKRLARFDIETLEDGSSLLTDTRTSEEPQMSILSADESCLMSFLDEPRAMVRLTQDFARAAPQQFTALGRQEGIAALLAAWQTQGFLVDVSGFIIALATPKPASEVPAAAHHQDLEAIVLA